MKTILKTTITLGALLLLTGCGNAGFAAGGERVSVKVVAVPDGRTIPCVVVSGSGTAISCDWSEQ